MNRSLLILIALSVLFGTVFAAGESAKRSERTFDIEARPWGPSVAQFDAARIRAEKSGVVRSALSGTKYRLLDVRYVEKDDGSAPTHYRAIFYDYTNDRAFEAESDFAGREPIVFRPSDIDLSVSASREEIDAGFDVVKSDPTLGPLFEAGKLTLSEPMPPLSIVNGERLVNIGIKYRETGKDEIVGISFKNIKVVFYGKNAPSTGELGEGGGCGMPSSGQGSTFNGTPGQMTVTLTREAEVVWEMLVVRPSASSGGPQERSGIEIRDAKYKGKSVFKRAHAPILNVKYINNACGPYRDWQYAEGPFQVPTKGTTYPNNGESGGFALLTAGQVPTTAVESGVDQGNFQGVAIYQQNIGFGNELVMVTEMNAGWYRYIMEWRFAEDGTIRPRYGFGSIANACVCAARNHHVYWRFDFDIVGSSNNIYKVERGRRFLTPITTETSMFRSYQTNRSLLIQNANGDEAYQLTPNFTDEEAFYKTTTGTLETFGTNDFWIMKFQGTPGAPDELDDPNVGPAANLDAWINGESIVGNDSVVWYGAHQFRSNATSLTTFDRSGLIISGVHVVGPDLRPVRW